MGWNAYLAALGSQAGEDFAGVEMLYLNPAPRARGVRAACARSSIPGTRCRWVALWSRWRPSALVALAAARSPGADGRGPRRHSVPGLPPAVPRHDLRPLRAAARAADRRFSRCAGWRRSRAAPRLPVAGGLRSGSVGIAAPVLAAYGSEPSPTVACGRRDRRQARTARAARRAGAAPDVPPAAGGRERARRRRSCLAASPRMARAGRATGARGTRRRSGFLPIRGGAILR